MASPPERGKTSLLSRPETGDTWKYLPFVLCLAEGYTDDLEVAGSLQDLKFRRDYRRKRFVLANKYRVQRHPCFAWSWCTRSESADLMFHTVTCFCRVIV